MSANIEQLPGEPIFIIALDPADRSMESTRVLENALNRMLDAQPEPVFLVNIMPNEYQLSVGELLEATQLIMAQGNLYQHRNVKGILAVTTNETLRIAYRGLSNAGFGGICVETFNTRSAALDYARANY